MVSVSSAQLFRTGVRSILAIPQAAYEAYNMTQAILQVSEAGFGLLPPSILTTGCLREISFVFSVPSPLFRSIAVFNFSASSFAFAIQYLRKDPLKQCFWSTPECCCGQR